MKEKPTYYAVISADVRYDKNLSANAKLLYGEITCLTNENGFCFATNKYFADLYEKSKVTISKWISELVVNGYVSTSYTYKEGTKEIDKRYISILKGGIKENLKGGIKENFKDNNTSINNTSIILSEVTSFFVKEKKTEQDAKDFFYYYEAIGWVVSKNPVRNWKALAKKWISNIKPQQKLKVLE